MLSNFKTQFLELQSITINVLQIFCAALYVMYRFIQMLHTKVKFSLKRKKKHITQLKTRLQQFHQ